MASAIVLTWALYQSVKYASKILEGGGEIKKNTFYGDKGMAVASHPQPHSLPPFWPNDQHLGPALKHSQSMTWARLVEQPARRAVHLALG